MRLQYPSFNTMFTQSYNDLTKREKEILVHISSGKKSKDIALELGLSKHTIDNHRKNMLRKTGTSNSMQLVVWAFRNQIIS